MVNVYVSRYGFTLSAQWIVSLLRQSKEASVKLAVLVTGGLLPEKWLRHSRDTLEGSYLPKNSDEGRARVRIELGLCAL